MNTVKINHKGIRDLLRSEEIAADLEDRAWRVADAAGEGHRVEVSIGPNRARAAIITDTYEAARSEAEDRTLTQAVDAAR